MQSFDESIAACRTAGANRFRGRAKHYLPPLGENGNFCFRVQNPKGPASVQPVPLDTAAQIANSYHGTLTLSEDTGCEVTVQIPLS
ncbi:MAG: hypothetical protein ACLSFT_09835 [Ruminococcus callidus]